MTTSTTKLENEMNKSQNEQITKIVWNGCDEYEIQNESVFTSREEFKPFDVIEIDSATIPTDEAGEVNFDGIFMTGDLRCFRAI